MTSDTWGPFGNVGRNTIEGPRLILNNVDAELYNQFQNA